MRIGLSQRAAHRQRAAHGSRPARVGRVDGARGTNETSWSSSVGLLALAIALMGCGGVISFSDTTPLAIRGPAPAAPPPPPAPKRVEVKKDRIQINEKIQFDLDKATIKPESHGLLDEIVSVLKQNPQIKKINIVGHTSDDGEDAYNQKLSEERAKSVRTYLAGHGIDAGRLTHEGRGESEPLVDNAAPGGRVKNRRVEFMIVEQDASGGSQ